MDYYTSKIMNRILLSVFYIAITIAATRICMSLTGYGQQEKTIAKDSSDVRDTGGIIERKTKLEE